MLQRRNWNIQFIFVAVSFLFSLLQHHLIIRLMGDQYVGSADAAKGVVLGYPHWRVYQNRVLGPYFIEWMSRFTSSFLSAYFIFSIIALTIAGFLAWHLGDRMKNRATGVLSFFLFQCAFSIVLDKNWLYAWDLVDLIVFFLFVIFVATDRSLTWFIALFLVAAFNRESALFVALWLIVDPVIRKALAAIRNSKERMDWKSVIAGVVCVVLSLQLTETLRQHLLVDELGFETWNIPRGAPEFGPHVHFKLFSNLDMLNGLFVLDYSLPFVPLLLILAFAAIALLAALRLSGKFISLAILQYAMLGGIVFFGVITETRVYFQMLPFLVLSVIALAIKQNP